MCFTSDFGRADTNLVSLLIPLTHKMTNPQSARRLQAAFAEECCALSARSAG